MYSLFIYIPPHYTQKKEEEELKELYTKMRHLLICTLEQKNSLNKIASKKNKLSKN